MLDEERALRPRGIGSTMFEFRIPGHLVRDAQYMNLDSVVVQDRLKLVIGHGESIDPMEVRTNRAVQAPISVIARTQYSFDSQV